MGRRLDNLVRCYVTQVYDDGSYVIDVGGSFKQGPMDAAAADKMCRTLNSLDGAGHQTQIRRVGSVR
jgi:hypothetical protein